MRGMADIASIPADPRSRTERLIELGRDREAVEAATRDWHPESAGNRLSERGGTMDGVEQLDEVIPTLVAVVERIGPDQLDHATPCAELTVAGVLEHMIRGAIAFAPAFRGAPSPGAEAAEVAAAGAAAPPGTHTAATPQERFCAAMADLGDAVHAPGARDRLIATPFGEMSGSAFARYVAFDGLVHGWDLTSATGQDYAPSQDVVTAVDGYARELLTPGLRDGTTFAAETEAPAGANRLERLVAFTGRRLEPAAMPATPDRPDLAAIKVRQQATWASGDYAVIGTTLQLVGESLCEALDVAAGSRVLDVAAGNGNAALAAARRGCRVTAADYVEGLLGQARRRAEADGLAVETRVADAEALPFDDAAFDAVLSTFGVMFTPDPERAAAELARVCRPGGRIGLANWTPGGFIGQMFKVIGRHVPPPAGVPSPLAWGTTERLDELLGAHARIEVTPRHFVFRYRSGADFVETFRTYYGPTVRAWGALDEAGREALRGELVALADEHNRDRRGVLAVPAEYLEVVAVRRS